MRSERGMKPLNLRDGAIPYRAGRSKAPEEREHAREFVAYYRGDEVYCKHCFPHGEDRDEFERLWLDMRDESDLEFTPVCAACGREFPEYRDNAFANAFVDLTDEGDFDLDDE